MNREITYHGLKIKLPPPIDYNYIHASGKQFGEAYHPEQDDLVNVEVPEFLFKNKYSKKDAERIGLIL